MKLSIKNAHPQGKGRIRNVPVKAIGVSAAGVNLPGEIDAVSIMLKGDDGEDMSSSTTYSVAFTIDDGPNQLDALIGRLTELRAHQHRRATPKKKSPCNRCRTVFTDEHTWEACLAAVPFNSPDAWRR